MTLLLALLGVALAQDTGLTIPDAKQPAKLPPDKQRVLDKQRFDHECLGVVELHERLHTIHFSGPSAESLDLVPDPFDPFTDALSVLGGAALPVEIAMAASYQYAAAVQRMDGHYAIDANGVPLDAEKFGARIGKAHVGEGRNRNAAEALGVDAAEAAVAKHNAALRARLKLPADTACPAKWFGAQYRACPDVGVGELNRALVKSIPEALYPTTPLDLKQIDDALVAGKWAACRRPLD